jgi:hypothetical protein
MRKFRDMRKYRCTFKLLDDSSFNCFQIHRMCLTLSSTCDESKGNLKTFIRKTYHIQRFMSTYVSRIEESWRLLLNRGYYCANVIPWTKIQSAPILSVCSYLTTKVTFHNVLSNNVSCERRAFNSCMIRLTIAQE